jgi:hypothetical protein
MSNKEKRDIDLTDCGEDSWYEPREVVDKGQLMTWQQAKTLEEQLGVDSNNAYNRLLLLGYYEKRVGTNKKNADGYFRHLDWFLREHPGHPFLSYSTFRPDKPDLQRRTLDAWKAALKRKPRNASAYNNAADSCFAPDEATQDLLQTWRETAFELDPDNELWSFKLAQHHMFRAGFYEDIQCRTLHASRSLDYLKTALDVHERFPAMTYHETYMWMTMQEFLQFALDQQMLDHAEYFSKYLIHRVPVVAKLYPEQWVNRRISGEVHLGLATLGKVRLTRGDVDGAKQHLANMAEMGDPTRGLDLLLAKQLLERGETEAVLQYLDGCISIVESYVSDLKNNPKYKRRLGDYELKRHNKLYPGEDASDYQILESQQCIEVLENYKKRIVNGRNAKIAIWPIKCPS